MPGVLEGIRVIDFGQYIAGPMAAMLLGDQGADVIRIDPPGGPRWNTPANATWNRNKRSIVLNLKQETDLETARQLIAGADVVIENFRPGVMERLGIGWPQLAQVNPQLIYCAVSGFGTTGPERRTASFDGKIQAMSGLMSLTGEPEQGPMRAGFAAADTTTGMMAAYAIACALYQRTHTRQGQFVDVSMLDSMINFLSGTMAEYTVAGCRHAQFGNRSVTRKPTADRFRCGAGYIVLAVLTGKQFASLLRTLDRADALGDPRFADWASRIANAKALRELIEGAMQAGDPKDWEARLTAADVPCATVFSLAEIAEHPQVAHRKLLQEVETPYGPVRLVGPAFHLAHGQGGFARPVADVGEHTDAVLAAAGYDAAEVAGLRERGVI